MFFVSTTLGMPCISPVKARFDSSQVGQSGCTLRDRLKNGFFDGFRAGEVLQFQHGHALKVISLAGDADERNARMIGGLPVTDRTTKENDRLPRVSRGDGAQCGGFERIAPVHGCKVVRERAARDLIVNFCLWG